MQSVSQLLIDKMTYKIILYYKYCTLQKEIVTE